MDTKPRRTALKSLLGFSMIGSTARADSTNVYELKSEVPITGFSGVKIDVRSYTKDKGAKTHLRKSTFKLTAYFKPRPELVSNVEIPIHLYQDGKIASSSSVYRSVRPGSPTQYKTAYLVFEAVVDNPYAGLANASGLEIYGGISFTDKRGKPLLHQHIKTACSKYSGNKSLPNAYFSPFDLVVVDKKGKLFIQPLFYKMKCHIKIIMGKPEIRINDTEYFGETIGGMKLPKDKRVNPRTFFDAREAHIVILDRKSGKSVSLISIPSRLIDAINKTFLETVKTHEADFRDGKGDVSPLSCFITTAACGIVGRPDDCWELNTLRRFRKRRLSATDIEEYQKISREILESELRKSSQFECALARFYFLIALPSAVLATLRADKITFKLYEYGVKQLLNQLRRG